MKRKKCFDRQNIFIAILWKLSFICPSHKIELAALHNINGNDISISQRAATTTTMPRARTRASARARVR